MSYCLALLTISQLVTKIITMVVKIMINTRLSVAIHILSMIASNSDKQLTSNFIASSVNTNPVVIRRISSMLKKAKLIESKTGVSGAILTKDPQNITLLDIYYAVRSEKDLFSIHDNPNPKCSVGMHIQATLDETFSRVQQAMEEELSNQTLKDVIEHLSKN